MQENPDDRSLNRRLKRNTLLFLIAALAFSLWLGSAEIVAGVALGGVLAILNQRLLEGGIRSLLSQVVASDTGSVPAWPASKLMVRYLIVALCFGIALLTGLFHPVGMAIGFASFVGGVMIEAGYQIYLVLKPNGSE